MFEPANLIAGMIFGLIGVAGFKYGKSQGSATRMLIGAALILYPYLMDNPYLLWGVGVVLTSALIAWKDE